MNHKFKTLPKIQSLQLIRNMNKVLVNNYIINTEYSELNEDLSLLYDRYEDSELTLSLFLKDLDS